MVCASTRSCGGMSEGLRPMPPAVMVLKLPNTWAMFRNMYLIIAPMSLMSLISLMRGYSLRVVRHKL
jgi:hypothetical protein